MIGTYASAALICAASLLVGRAILSLAGTARVVLAGAGGRLRRAAHRRPACWRGRPGTATTRDARRSSLLVVAAAVVALASGRVRGAPGALLRDGLPVARSSSSLVLAIPFAVSGRWGLLGVGFNNDLGLHLAWAEWLRSGFGPAPDAGYPLGPHGARGRRSPRCRGSASARPSSARSSRSASSPALTALGGAARARARRAARSPRRWSPSPTSPPPTSPRPPSRRPPRRSSSSPSRSTCTTSTGGAASGRAGRRLRFALPARWRSPAASSSPTASPGSPGRWRSSRSGA